MNVRHPSVDSWIDSPVAGLCIITDGGNSTFPQEDLLPEVKLQEICKVEFRGATPPIDKNLLGGQNLPWDFGRD